MKQPANDNQKWERFDEAVREVFRFHSNWGGASWGFITKAFRQPPNYKTDSPYRSHENFLWFVRFENSFKQTEIEMRREEIRVVE
jgi:hypothetical protein